MLAVHLTCPRCLRSLRSNRLIAPGEMLRCPHCGVSFRAGLDAPAANAASNPGPGVHSALAAWLVFAVVLLLAFGGLVVAVLVSKRAAPPAAAMAEARGAVSTPDVPSAPKERADAPAADPPPPPLPVDPPPQPKPRLDPPPAHPTPPPPPLPEPTPAPPPARPTPPKSENLRSRPAPTANEAPQVHWLPPRAQRHVDRAIDGGVEYLRRQQNADGSWGHQSGKAGKRFTPGITALAALTLLECGVPAKDPQVQLTARYLRKRMPDLTVTYSTALAILFFDRLGAAEDVPRIRTLALRLIAGQKPSGGWDYYCPALSEEEELGLLARLYEDRPTTPRDLFPAEPIQPAKFEGELATEDRKLDSDLYRPRPSKTPPLELFIAEDANAAPRPIPPREEEKKQTENREPKAESQEPKPKSRPLPGDVRKLSERAREAASRLSQALRKTPALRAAELMQEVPNLREPRTDHSNTQFAILGLLIAENHDVPMERAMALLDWRFRHALTIQQGWNYQPGWPTTPSMTAAGLMGLALKHGLLLPNKRDRGRNVSIRDPLIHRGFATLEDLLEGYVTGFQLNPARLEKLDLYCLWTVERVAVLYNLRTLGAFDWYPAGVQLLLPLQRDNGSWSSAGTKALDEPSVSTSFALLFLKRSNLARDLTRRLNAPEAE